MGLGDCACLVGVLEKGVASGQDSGLGYVLEGYARERVLHDGGMLFGVDLIGRLFRGSSSSMGMMRQVGLDLLNNSSFLKVSYF